MKQQVIETLEAVRELLAVPERWTQMAMARDAKGVPINPHSPSATCWCLAGALDVAIAWTPKQEVYPVLDATLLNPEEGEFAGGWRLRHVQRQPSTPIYSRCLTAPSRLRKTTEEL